MKITRQFNKEYKEIDSLKSGTVCLLADRCLLPDKCDEYAKFLALVMQDYDDNGDKKFKVYDIESDELYSDIENYKVVEEYDSELIIKRKGE